MTGHFAIAPDHREVSGIVFYAVVLLVGAVMFLIYDDESQLCEWGKQRRAGTNGNVCFSGRIRRHSRSRSAGLSQVQDRNLVAKPRSEPPNKLRRQGYLGHQHQDLISAIPNGLAGL